MKSSSSKRSKQAQLAGVRAKLNIPVDDPVYDALTEWRRDTAKADSVPAYVVFNNRTLAAIADELPSNEAELLQVSGVGPAKVERYAEDVLAIIEEYS